MQKTIKKTAVSPAWADARRCGSLHFTDRDLLATRKISISWCPSRNAI